MINTVTSSIDLYYQRTPFTPADEATLTTHGFIDTGVEVTDEEGNEFMKNVKNGDDVVLKGKKEYKVKIKNLSRHNAHKINFTLEKVS
jgi:uncharacterized membrane-anchored protein